MTEAPRPRRDVVANRARILEAAQAVLAEQGISADMRAIARRAEVGIGTLYRHFPTREHLLRVITGSDLGRLADARLAADVPALDALHRFFLEALDQLAGNRAMVELLANAPASEMELDRCVAHLTSLGRQAVERARVDHTLAADVTPTDIAYQFLALARVVQLLPDAPAQRRRPAIEHQVDLALRGLARTSSGL